VASICAATLPLLSVQQIVYRYFGNWWSADTTLVRFWVFRDKL